MNTLEQMIGEIVTDLPHRVGCGEVWVKHAENRIWIYWRLREIQYESQHHVSELYENPLFIDHLTHGIRACANKFHQQQTRPYKALAAKRSPP